MNNKFLYISIIALLLLKLFPQAYSQEGTSLLWKISGNGLSKPSYLYGTVHAIPADKFFLPEQYKTILKGAEKLVLEIDMSSPTMMQEIQAEMLMNNNLTVDSLLSKKDLETVSAFFKDSLGVPLSFVRKIKPFYLSAIIMLKYIGANHASYEKTFMAIAQESQIKIMGLETIKEQTGFIDQVSLNDQVKFLLESVNDYALSKQQYFQMIEIYKTGDVQKVYNYMVEIIKEYKEFGEILINRRNKNWAEKIPTLISNESCFIAVGCGHLGGTQGVLALLKDKGYNLEPVKDL